MQLLELLGDVVEQKVGRDGERPGLHERRAGCGERDHPPRHVGVKRGDDDRRAAPFGLRDRAIGHLGVVGEHDQRGAELDHALHRVGTVAADDDVAPGDPAVGSRIHGIDPHSARERGVLAGDERALEHGDDRAHPGRAVGERRRASRVADVTAGERPLGEHPGERPLLVDHGHELEVGLGHRPAGLAHGIVDARDGERLLHHIPRAQHHVGEPTRLAGPRSLEQPPRLGVELPEANRLIVVAGVHPVLDLGEADRGSDRIGVRVAVTGDVDRAHERRLLPAGAGSCHLVGAPRIPAIGRPASGGPARGRRGLGCREVRHGSLRLGESRIRGRPRRVG